MKWSIFIIIQICLTACLFSGNDIDEVALVDNYYLVYSGDGHRLIKKDDNALTSAIIISSDIDSIGYDSEYILAVSGTKYFVVNYQSQDGDKVRIFGNRTEIANEVYVSDIIVRKVH